MEFADLSDDPHSVRPADVRYDLAHGAPRRLVTHAVRRFTETLDPNGRYVELGAGHYDHRSFLPSVTTINIDAAQRPDVLGDLHELPYESASFDGGVCISVLEHVDDPYRVVREWARITKPGGRVFAWVPFFFGVHGYPEDVSRFTDHGVTRLFELSGFRVERADADPYRGLFLNVSDAVHFVVPRASSRRWVRGANKALFLASRAAFPLDRRLRMRSLYAGVDVVAVRDHDQDP